MQQNESLKKQFDLKTALPRIISLAIGLFITVFCIASAIYILVTGDDPYNRFIAVIGGIF